MNDILKTDHNLDLQNNIKINDLYYQFSKKNTERKIEQERKWKDCLETILMQLDTHFHLLCMTPDTESDRTKFLMSARSELMDKLVSDELIKKYKYNTRTGMSKVNITKSLDPNTNSHVGLVFFSNYFELNILLVDRQNKKYFHVKDPIPEQLYIMINITEDEFIPPIALGIAGDSILKKEDINGYLHNMIEVFELKNITSNIEPNIKNIKNIYKKDTISSETKKITQFKIVELQNMANSHNISIKTSDGKKKTKAQLFDELKDLF